MFEEMNIYVCDYEGTEKVVLNMCSERNNWITIGNFFIYSLCMSRGFCPSRGTMNLNRAPLTVDMSVHLLLICDISAYWIFIRILVSSQQSTCWVQGQLLSLKDATVTLQSSAASTRTFERLLRTISCPLFTPSTPILRHL